MKRMDIQAIAVTQDGEKIICGVSMLETCDGLQPSKLASLSNRLFGASHRCVATFCT
jgi:hypothetical protein